MEQRLERIDNLRIWILDQLHSYEQEPENCLHSLIRKQQAANAWLTDEFTLISLYSAEKMLSSENIESAIKTIHIQEPKHIGIIPSLDIPLAGLPECIIALLFGYNIYFKEDNQQNILLKGMVEAQPAVAAFIHFVSDFPKTIDAWIIHSDKRKNNQTFTAYFKQKKCLLLAPSLHIGILTGNETDNDLENLAGYIFVHWGYHGDNIRKLYFPKEYSFDRLFMAFEKYYHLKQHNRYANHYEYQKCILQMKLKQFMDNGFVLLFETDSLQNPIGCIGYEYYESENDLKHKLQDQERKDESVILRYSYISAISKYGVAAENFSNESMFGPIIEFLNGL